MAIVDPAGLPYISGKAAPGLAGAASCAIYDWLDLRGAEAFPPPVQEAITEATQAKFHTYGDKMCIHVVGPDFREEQLKTSSEVSARLTKAYANVFTEFASSPAKQLRLLPISSGVFAGRFGKEMPKLTAKALIASFFLLSEEARDR